MNHIARKIMLFAATLAVAAAIGPAARADSWNQKTVFTFSAPVEIPGQVLPAGTYVFKLADAAANRHIVQVFNQAEDHVFGTFLAIPDYRLKTPEKTILTFHERPVGSPEAVRAWFYPGHNVGHEFVYPKQEAQSLAKLNDVPVPAVAEELAPEMKLPVEIASPRISELILAPVLVEEPDGQEVAVEQAIETEAPRNEAETETMPQELPETGSALPLIALIGAASLAGAGILSRAK